MFHAEFICNICGKETEILSLYMFEVPRFKGKKICSDCDRKLKAEAKAEEDGGHELSDS
jgi:superfamily II helicase